MISEEAREGWRQNLQGVRIEVLREMLRLARARPAEIQRELGIPLDEAIAVLREEISSRDKEVA